MLRSVGSSFGALRAASRSVRAPIVSAPLKSALPALVRLQTTAAGEGDLAHEASSGTSSDAQPSPTRTPVRDGNTQAIYVVSLPKEEAENKGYPSQLRPDDPSLKPLLEEAKWTTARRWRAQNRPVPWRYLSRRQLFANYQDAFAFAAQVAEHAKAVNHDPRLELDRRILTIDLVTHQAILTGKSKEDGMVNMGCGITMKDIEFARWVDEKLASMDLGQEQK